MLNDVGGNQSDSTLNILHRSSYGRCKIQDLVLF